MATAKLRRCVQASQYISSNIGDVRVQRNDVLSKGAIRMSSGSALNVAMWASTRIFASLSQFMVLSEATLKTL